MTVCIPNSHVRGHMDLIQLYFDLRYVDVLFFFGY